MGSIHLVRHGQASFGEVNYDQLSALGHQQARLLGDSWKSRGEVWTDLISGSMRRHEETAAGALSSDDYAMDPRWDEYELSGIPMHGGATSSSDQKLFQLRLNEAMAEWMAGTRDLGEAYVDFSSRVLTAFRDATKAAGPKRQVVIFTSAGPISLVVSHALTGSDTLFRELNDVVVNSSVTTFIVGSTGPRLLAFNGHSHLPRSATTFR